MIHWQTFYQQHKNIFPIEKIMKEYYRLLQEYNEWLWSQKKPNTVKSSYSRLRYNNALQYTPDTQLLNYTDIANVLNTNVRLDEFQYIDPQVVSIIDIDAIGNKITSISNLYSYRDSLQELYLYDQLLTTINVNGLSNLIHFDCYNNSLTSLDTSGLTSLQVIDCTENYLTELNLDDSPNIKEIICNGNDILQLNLTYSTQLYALYCNRNGLTDLELDSKVALQNLDCQLNNLSILNLSGSQNLVTCYCNSNQLTTLDLSGSTSLVTLHCDSNNLTHLNLSGSTSLVTLHTHDNQLTDCNFTGLTQLEYLDCHNNLLTTLNTNGFVSLNDLDGSNNALSQQVVDHILLNLDTYGIVSGSVDLSGGTNAVPSESGSNAIFNLINKNWIVNVNACLIGSTIITMSDHTNKLIKDLKVNDKLLSYDNYTKSYTEVTVTDISVYNSVVYNINNGLLVASPTHNHYVKPKNKWYNSIIPNNRWHVKTTIELNVGDFFVDINKNEIKITSINKEPDLFEVYNLKVSGNHLYYANNVLTHNK
jgi:hypothetical protein